MLPCALLLAGCTLALPALPTSAPTVSPTEASPPVWEALASGLERRMLGGFSGMMTLRVDPAHYTFRVHYRPGQPLTAQQWADALPNAVALVNANFFSAQHQAVGLLVADGVPYSPVMPNLGGIFQVQAGQARVRSNIAEPYAGEALEQAVQAYPMLVLNGSAAYPGGQPDRPTRRTLIGQDDAGRILLLATPLLGMSLADLSAYLPMTDLRLLNAFNLDGGSSTLMVIRPPDNDPYIISSFDPVPAVLAVYPR
jgi:exopolysaccharide biosynthesis protein